MERDWKRINKETKECTLTTTINDMFNYYEIESTLDTIKTLQMNDELATRAVDDRALLTATLEEILETKGVRLPSKLLHALTEPKMADACNWCDEREAIKIVQNESNKLAPLIKASTLKELNLSALEGEFNSTSIEKLDQC